MGVDSPSMVARWKTIQSLRHTSVEFSQIFFTAYKFKRFKVRLFILLLYKVAMAVYSFKYENGKFWMIELENDKS